jgi:hypothetical protein
MYIYYGMSFDSLDQQDKRKLIVDHIILCSLTIILVWDWYYGAFALQYIGGDTVCLSVWCMYWSFIVYQAKHDITLKYVMHAREKLQNI